MNMINHVIC